MGIWVKILAFGSKYWYLGQNIGYLGQNIGYLGQDIGYLGQDIGYLGQSIGYLGQNIGYLSHVWPFVLDTTSVLVGGAPSGGYFSPKKPF